MKGVCEMKLLTKSNKIGIGLMLIALSFYFFPLGNDIAYWFLMFVQGQSFIDATTMMYAITIVVFLAGCWLAEVRSLGRVTRKFKGLFR